MVELIRLSLESLASSADVSVSFTQEAEGWKYWNGSLEVVR